MAKSKEGKDAKAKATFQKQRANVYTMMLIMAFLILTGGCFVLFKELDSYRGIKPNGEKGDIEFVPPKQAPPATTALRTAAPQSGLERLVARLP